MTFSRITWVNGPGGGTKLNATNLNRIETGIYDSHYNALITADANANIAATVRGFSASQSGDLLRVQKQSDSDTYLRVGAAGIVSVEKGGELKVLAGSEIPGEGSTQAEPVGSRVFEVSDIGDIWMGPNTLDNPATHHTGTSAAGVPDFFFDAAIRATSTRGLNLTQVRDPVDLIIGRIEGGLDGGGEDDITFFRRVQAESNLGAIYWRGAEAANDNSLAGWGARSAQIFVRAAEAFTATAHGGHMLIATTPSGGTSLTERLVITAAGTIGVLGDTLTYAQTRDGGSRGELWVSSAAVTANARRAIVLGNAAVGIYFGTGSPESAVTAPQGSLFLRQDGGTDTTLYTKSSGSGNTGWLAVDNV